MQLLVLVLGTATTGATRSDYLVFDSLSSRHSWRRERLHLRAYQIPPANAWIKRSAPLVKRKLLMNITMAETQLNSGSFDIANKQDNTNATASIACAVATMLLVGSFLYTIFKKELVLVNHQRRIPRRINTQGEDTNASSDACITAVVETHASQCCPDDETCSHPEINTSPILAVVVTAASVAYNGGHDRITSRLQIRYTVTL